MEAEELFKEDVAVAAYTAGIIDGEGCIRLQPKTYGLDVSVGNTDINLLVWLKEQWGGKIYPNRSHSPKINAKPFFHWRVCSALAFPMLRQILPFLVIKADRARKALELQPLHMKKNNYEPGYNERYREMRKKIYDDLKVMNQRGLN